MEINYNDFESLLNQGKNNYNILIRFLNEGSYKILFSIKYFIRHKKIEEYIESTEESILEFTVMNPFLLAKDLNSNNFLKYMKLMTKIKRKKKIKSDII